MHSMPRSRLDSARRFLRSNLLGLVAIFIVLGGTAIALPGKNKVDSGDIKQGQVRTLDIHRSAVTKSKLRRNAVDGSRVRNNSLTADDIDESTLDLDPPLKAGAVTEREEADRERRIAIGAGELTPALEGDPEIVLNGGVPAVFLNPEQDDSVSAITEVPLDRAAGTGLQVRLLWDGGGAGAVTWNVGFDTYAPGESLGGITDRVEVTAPTAGGALVETAVLDIPASALQNGRPLAISVIRNGDATSDTSLGFAFLRLVEIRYTATG